MALSKASFINLSKRIMKKDIFEEQEQKDLKKLTDVGFTKEQAEVLLELIKQKAFSGGYF